MNRPAAETVELLAHYLAPIVRANDAALAENKDSQIPPTRFHARNVPTIDLHGYMTRILKYSPCTSDCFLALLIYLERAAGRGSFASSGEDSECLGWVTNDVPGEPRHLPQRPLVLTSFNIHRLLLAGMLVSVKFLSDVFYTNAHMSRVGGVPVKELNRLEIEFLLLMDFDLAVTLEELAECGRKLESFEPEDHESLEALAKVFLADFPTGSSKDIRLDTGSLRASQHSLPSPSPMQALPPSGSLSSSQQEGLPCTTPAVPDMDNRNISEEQPPLPREATDTAKDISYVASPTSPSVTTLTNSPMAPSTPIVQTFVIDDRIAFPESSPMHHHQKTPFSEPMDYLTADTCEDPEVFSRSSSPSYIPSALSTPSSAGGTLAACFSWLLRETPVLSSFATGAVSDSISVSTKSVFTGQQHRDQQQSRLKQLLSHSSKKTRRRSSGFRTSTKGRPVTGLSVKPMRKKKSSSSLSVSRYQHIFGLSVGGCRMKRKRLLFTRKPQRRDE